MILTIIKGILIGIIASIPIGPIGVFVMQKSMNSGWKIGMQSSLGCIIFDTLFAALSVVSYTVIFDFISANSTIIELIGGAVVVAVGIAMALSTPSTSEKPQRRTKKGLALDMSKSFFMGLANPGNFAWMLALYAAFNMHVADAPFLRSVITVLSIGGGSFLYWLGFSWVASRGNKSFKPGTIVRVNQASGVLVTLFGLYMLVTGIVEQFFS